MGRRRGPVRLEVQRGQNARRVSKCWLPAPGGQGQGPGAGGLGTALGGEAFVLG